MKISIKIFLAMVLLSETSWGAEGYAPPANLLMKSNTTSVRAQASAPPANMLIDKICFDAPEARVRHQDRRANIVSLLKGGGDYCPGPDEAMRIVNCPDSAYKYFNGGKSADDIIELCDALNTKFCEGFDCGVANDQKNNENSRDGSQGNQSDDE